MLAEHPMAEVEVLLEEPVDTAVPVEVALVDATPGAALQVSPPLLGHMRALMALDDAQPLDLDVFLKTHAIVGSARARAWWQTTCFPRGTGVLNLDGVRDYAAARLGELDELRNRAYEQGRSRHEITVDDVSLELAAQVIYLEGYPETREGLDIGLEVTGETSLGRLILSILARNRHSAGDGDFAMVPDQPTMSRPGMVGRSGAMAQYQAAAATVAVPAHLRSCICCGETFAPKKGVPQAAFCALPNSTESECGLYDHALHTWAMNATRTPDMARIPVPDVYDFLRHARGNPQRLQQAMAWGEERLQFWKDDAARQFARMAGTAA